jgi:hypothetical protein
MAGLQGSTPYVHAKRPDMWPDFLLLFFRTIARFVVNANLEKTFDGGDTGLQ